MLLPGRTAIVYGAGGTVGSAVAKAFATEGARVFLVGRTKEKLELVAASLATATAGAGAGSAEVAVVDTLDEHAVDAHVESVVACAGGIDISFNLVAPGDVRGIPLVDMTTADFLRPITTGVTAAFITARAAARHMVRQGSGVLLALDRGGGGPAGGALESLVRDLAVELGPQGVRVAGIHTAGLARPAEVAAAATFLASDQAGAITGWSFGCAPG